MYTTIRTMTTRLAAVAALAMLAACESSTAGGMGTVRLYLVGSGGGAMVSSLVLDPPSGTLTDPAVDVASVELIPGRHEIASFDPAQTFQLTPMDHGLGALLSEATVPAGEYEQLRLVLTGASVMLDGSLVDLGVPSGSTTGIKLNFGGPVEVVEGGETNLIIVLDLDQSFVFHGPPADPSVSFKPVIHASVIPGATISGTITLDVAAGAGGKAVTVTATSASSEGSTVVTVLEGATTAPYSVRFLQAGDYTMGATATACTLVLPAPTTTVTEGGTASVNISLDC